MAKSVSIVWNRRKAQREIHRSKSYLQFQPQLQLEWCSWQDLVFVRMRDWLRTVKNQELVTPKGRRWCYSTACQKLLRSMFNLKLPVRTVFHSYFSHCLPPSQQYEGTGTILYWILPVPMRRFVRVQVLYILGTRTCTLFSTTVLVHIK